MQWKIFSFTRKKISTTTRNMYKWPFFANNQTSTCRKDHSNTFDNKCPFTQITIHDKSRENRFDFRNTFKRNSQQRKSPDHRLLTWSTGIGSWTHNKNNNKSSIYNRPKDKHKIFQKPRTNRRWIQTKNIRPSFPLKIKLNNFVLLFILTYWQISLWTSSNWISREPQQHCSRLSQNAGLQKPVRQWLIHLAPISTKPATRPRRKFEVSSSCNQWESTRRNAD